MNNEIQKIEKRLADTETTVSQMSMELNKVTGELSALDVSAGDVDKIVDTQIRLSTKKSVLEKRVELANIAAERLRGDLLVERERELKEQLKKMKEKLNEARENTEFYLMELTGGGELALHEQGIVKAFVEIHKNVRPLIAEVEQLTHRYNEAEARAQETNRKRLMAESAAVAQIQSDVFEGKI